MMSLCFMQIMKKKIYWGSKNHTSLKKKGNGLSFHISDFLTEINGHLKYENNKACVIMKSSNNRNRW